VIDRHLITLAIALQHIDDDVPRLQAWGQTVASVLIAGGRLFTCGSGSSAQQARHLVTELTHPEDDRPPLAVGMLPVRSDGRDDYQPGDIVLCLSAIEADEQVASVAATAGESGMTSWALTGPTPNAVAAACAEAISVDAAVTSTIEEVHLAAIHILCAAVNSAVRDTIQLTASAEDPLAVR